MHNTKKGLFCLLLLLFLLLASCGRGTESHQSTPQTDVSSSESSTAGSVFESDQSLPSMPEIEGLALSDTVMELGENKLTLADFNYIAAAAKEDRLYYYKFLFFDFYDGDGSDFSYKELLEYVSNGKTVAEMILDDVVSIAKNMLSCENLMQSLKVFLPDSTLQRIDDHMSDLVSSMGGEDAFEKEMTRLGTSKESVVRYQKYFETVDFLKEFLYGENGIEPPAESDVLAAFEATCVRLCGGSFPDSNEGSEKADQLLSKLKSNPASSFPLQGSDGFSEIKSQVFRFSDLPDDVADKAKETKTDGFFAVRVETVGCFVMKKENFAPNDIEDFRGETEALAKDNLLTKKLSDLVNSTVISSVLAESYDISAIPSPNDRFYN